MWSLSEGLPRHGQGKRLHVMSGPSIVVRLAVLGVYGRYRFDPALVLCRYGCEKSNVSIMKFSFWLKNKYETYVWFSSCSFTKSQLILHLSAFLEVSVSAAITLLIFEPMGSLYFHSCSVNYLSDWYTLFHNPTPNYGEKLHCTQEAVYPL